MSKISDELRVAANLTLKYGSDDYNRIHNLADRIDREMMERPLAADGKLLVDGETVYDSNGRKYHVNEVYPLVNVSTSTHSCSMFPDRFTHKRPDSLERIADELEAKASSCGHQGFAVVSRDEVAEIAARIRALAVKGDWR